MLYHNQESIGEWLIFERQLPESVQCQPVNTYGLPVEQRWNMQCREYQVRGPKGLRLLVATWNDEIGELPADCDGIMIDGKVYLKGCDANRKLNLIDDDKRSSSKQTLISDMFMR